MNKQRIEALTKSAPNKQLIIMKRETLTQLDKYINERDRCEFKNPSYINYGLNLSITKSMKKVSALDLILEKRNLTFGA